MESIKLVEQLKSAIEDEFRGAMVELEQEKAKVCALEGENEELNKTVQEQNDKICSLVKTLKDLKEKYTHLYDKLKKKQEEINMKEKWWDKYRLTAETIIKKLRTLGTFSPNVLHEVSRDLVDIIEDSSSTESVSSQDGEGRKTISKKLTTSKDGKKKFRYSEVPRDNLAPETKRTQQHKDTEVKSQKGSIKSKTQNLDMQRNSSSPSKSNPEIGQSAQISFPEDQYFHDKDESTSPGCPSLTSTPVLTSAPTILPTLSLCLPDVSIIPRESEAITYKHSKKADSAPSDQRKEKDKNTKRTDFNNKDGIETKNRLASTLETLDNEVNSAVSPVCCTSPSILPSHTEKKQFEDTEVGPEREIREKKRWSKNVETSGSKRMKIDDDITTNRMKAMSNLQSETTKKVESDAKDQASVVLLSSGDEEDGDRLGSGSVDMFYEPEECNTNKEEKLNEDYSSTRSLSNKNPKDSAHQPTSKHFEEFPGFRKPDELKYKNIEVVRKKDERSKLKGFSCRECAEYYGALNLNDMELKKRLKQCSRHRAKHSPPPSTPPGFWNLSFPATQEYMREGLLKTEEHQPPKKERRPRRRKLLAKERLK